MGAGASSSHVSACSVVDAASLKSSLRRAWSAETVVSLAQHAASPTSAAAVLSRLAALGAPSATLASDARLAGAVSTLLGSLPSELSSRTLCNVLWALATLRPALALAVPQEWLRACEAALTGALPSLAPPDAANCLWGLASLAYRPSQRWLRTWCGAWVSGLAAHDADWSAPASLRGVHPRALERCLVSFATLGECPDAGVLCATAEALARWEHGAAPGCQEEAEQEVQEAAPTVPPDALAHCLWALATLHVSLRAESRAALVRLAARTFPQCSAADLATCFWALASLGVDPGAAWCAALESRLEAVEASFDGIAERTSSPSQAASRRATLLWCYATLGRHPGAAVLDAHAHGYLAAAEREGSPGGSGASSQAFPEAAQKAIWAVASLSHRPGGAWLVRMADLLTPRLDRFDGQGLATLLWGFATLGASPGAEMLAKAADVWRSRLGSSPAPPMSALSNSLWAFASLSFHPGEAWLDAAANALRRSLSDLPPAALASGLWALASLSFAPQRGFLSCASDAAAAHLGSMSCGELSQVLWAFASLSHHPGRPWLEAFARCAVPAVAPPPPAQAPAATCLSNLLWGLLVLREHAAFCTDLSGSATLATWNALVTMADSGAAADAGTLRTLLTAEMLVGAEAPALASALVQPRIPAQREAWRQPALTAWKTAAASASASMASSSAHRDVTRGLSLLKVPHAPSVVTSDGLLCLDVQLTGSGSRTALQLDGGAAFVRNVRPCVANGTTLLRDRLYEALGVRVVTLPLSAWPRQGGQEARAVFLRRLLGRT